MDKIDIPRAAEDPKHLRVSIEDESVDTNHFGKLSLAVFMPREVPEFHACSSKGKH